MKKLFVALVLFAAFCMIAVSPAFADPNTNPANQGINSSSPFWFPDYTPSIGGTLSTDFNVPAYKPSIGGTLSTAFNIPAYKPSIGGTLSTAFNVPAYTPSDVGTWYFAE